MVSQGEVKTDVDRLLDFVKQKKEISIEDAAKQLGMPAKTIEALADLLEEEGMLHLKYKFTTPYLASEIPQSEKKSPKEENKEFVAEKEEEKPKKGEKEEKGPEIKDKGTAEEKKEEGKQKEKGEVPPEKIKPESPVKKKEEIQVPETDDIDQLIGKANEFISRGNFEAARKVYLKIKRLKQDLPKKFMEKEKKVEEGLVEVNESLVGGIDKAISTDFSKKIKDIESLFTEADSLTKSGGVKSIDSLKKVEDVYSRIKDIYLSLPAGFMEKKMSIQDRMLSLYRTIISSRKSLLAEDFRSKSDRIVQLMNQLAQKLKENRIDEANKIFRDITSTYKSLPRGFLKEKTDLQKRILTLYQQMILNREEVFSKEINEKSEKINALLHQASNLAGMGKTGRAKAIYNKATDLYSSLPEGFYDIRAGLEIKMLDLHHLITLKESKESLHEMKAKEQEIESLMQSATGYIKNREFELAKEAYKEVVKAYNSMPEGFLDKNLKIREKIVRLYKELLSHETEPMIGEADSDTVKTYSQLLKLLVQIHDHIKKKEFSSIKDKYFAAYRLYHQLPLSFLEKKTSIYREIYKIYEELKLYTSVMKLSEYANNQEYDRLKEQLNILIDHHKSLKEKYPEDMELFRFVHSKILIYLDMVKGKKAATGKDVRKKVEDASRLKKKESIKKPPELSSHEKEQARPEPAAAGMPGVHPSQEEGGVEKAAPAQETSSAIAYLKNRYKKRA